MNVEIYGHGTPHVFIHGAGGSTLSWMGQKAYFEKKCAVILVDLPGHGKSDGEAFPSIELYADAVKNVLDGLSGGPAIITGHSMGGAVAMDLALRYPGNTKGIVLIGTGARLKVYPEILEGIRKDKEATSRMIIDTAFSPKIPQTFKDRVFTEYMKNDAGTIFNDFTACDTFNLMERLGEIKVPTLVICGTDDRFTPPKYSRYLAGNIPGAQLELVEGAGHMVMIEAPEAVNQLIETFTARQRY